MVKNFNLAVSQLVINMECRNQHIVELFKSQFEFSQSCCLVSVNLKESNKEDCIGENCGFIK